MECSNQATLGCQRFDGSGKVLTYVWLWQGLGVSCVCCGCVVCLWGWLKARFRVWFWRFRLADSVCDRQIRAVSGLLPLFMGHVSHYAMFILAIVRCFFLVLVTCQLFFV
jgi:hypothetical protein